VFYYRHTSPEANEAPICITVLPKVLLLDEAQLSAPPLRELSRGSFKFRQVFLGEAHVVRSAADAERSHARQRWDQGSFPPRGRGSATSPKLPLQGFFLSPEG
jgi:hypothetical protein